MNLRDIKKDIEYVVGAFIEDCSLFASLHSDSASESVENLLGKAVNLYNDLRDKVNSKTEKKNAAYYKAIRKERQMLLPCPCGSESVFDGTFRFPAKLLIGERRIGLYRRYVTCPARRELIVEPHAGSLLEGGDQFQDGQRLASPDIEYSIFLFSSIRRSNSQHVILNLIQ